MTTTTAARRTSGGHLQFDPTPALELARQQCLASGYMNPTGNPVGADMLAARMGLNKRSIVRYRSGQWMHRDTADRVALALGRHPGEIWPEWWTA